MQHFYRLCLYLQSKTSRKSDDFVLKVMNSFIRCRTCFTLHGEVYTSISNVCYLNKSVKQVITMLVPQMGKTLADEDFTCKNCFVLLKNCMIFIEKCLEIETERKANRQILNLDSNESEGAATIKGPEKTSQPLLRTYANLRDKRIQNKDIEKENRQENHVTNVRTVCMNGQQLTCIRQGDPTFEKSVQEMNGLVLLVPQFSGINIPVVKPKTNCDVNLLPNLENATNEDDLQQNNYLTFHLDKSHFAIDHNYWTQAKLLNRNDHNRVVTLGQPNGMVIPDFITYLLQSKIKVLQITKNPERSISNTKKRILLLGKTKSIKCPKCLKYFEDIKIYNKHRKYQERCQKEQKVNSPRPKVCRLCDKKIEAHQIKLHRRQHELEKRNERGQKPLNLICQTCSERFTSKEDYKLHLKFHPPYICDQCGKRFIHKHALHSHKNSHNASNSAICEICGEGFKDIHKLRYHFLNHQDKMFKCDKCSKLFTTNPGLKRHSRSVHDKKDRVQCNQCGILLSTKGCLNLHIRLTHLKMKPFKCKICGKEFGRADYVQTHLKSHTGETSTQQRRYRNDKVTIMENKGKPVACKFCGKCISSVNNLKKHLKIHIRTRRYACQFCPLTFAEEQFRRRHELIHQNVDSIFRCNICFKRSKTKEELEEHITTKHKNPRYACDTCGQLFHRKYLLLHHNSQEHMTADDLEKREEMIRKSMLESIRAD